MVEPGINKRNELLEYAREQRGWSRAYVGERINVTELNMVKRWEREGILPHTHYRQALRTLFECSPRELGLVKKGDIPFWNVPYRRNPFFTGRNDTLSQLHSSLMKEGSAALTQIHAIRGLGGIGKTQVAIEYAYRYGHLYQSVLWARAESQEALTSDFAAIAKLLRLTESDTKDQQRAAEAVKRWLEALTRWLLILDNVEDMQFISDFIPLRGKGHILLTTRMQFTGTVSHGIDIDVMGLEEGAYFLLRRAKLIDEQASFNSVPESDYASAKELSKLMQGLPLALDQAGAYIEETECSINEYLELYKDQGIALLNEHSSLAFDHPEGAVSTLLLSFEKVQQANPKAMHLLQLCAFLHPDAIPEEIIIAGASEPDCDLGAIASSRSALNACIRELRKLSLIRRDVHTKILTIHRLVQAVVKSALDIETRRLWAKRVVLATNRAFPELQVATWSQYERLLSHAQVCLELITEYQFEFPEAAQLLDLAGSYLYERGRYAEADPFLHGALKISEKVAGYEHPDTATCLNHLGQLSHAQGKHEQAEAFYQRAREMREKILGSEHPDTATILYNLAVLYQAQGKYKQAELLYQQAFRIREMKLGAEHLDTVTCLNDLAVLYADQGKFEQAEALEKRVLEIREKVLDADHPDTAISLSNLAGFYHFEGKYDLAEPLFIRASAIFEKSLGVLHPNTATSFDNLAAFYLDQGKYNRAEELSRRALVIKEKVLGPEHPDVSQSLTTLALVYQAQGKYEQAELFFQRALTIYEEALGPGHAYTAGSLTYLAALYTEQGKYELAEPLARQALAIKEKVLGPEHAKTASSFDSLADIYLAQGKLADAEAFCKQALAIRQSVLEPEHLSIADSLTTLAKIYRAEGKYQEAELLVQQALAIRKHTLESEQPEGKKSAYTREDANPLKSFLAACCELHPEALSLASELWKAYQRWTQENGVRFPIQTQKAFGQLLKSIGCTPFRTNKNRMWRGITLRDRQDKIT